MKVENTDSSLTNEHLEAVNIVLSNELLKLNIEYEKAILEHREDILMIESRPLIENISEKELSQFYLKEAEEVKKKKEGILTKIISKIKDFFAKIKSFFTKNKSKEEELPDQVRVPIDPSELEMEGRELNKALKQQTKGKKIFKNTLKVAGVVTGGALIAKGLFIAKSKLFNDMLSESEQQLQAVQNLINSSNVDPQQADVLKSLVTRQQSFGSKVLNFFKPWNNSKKSTPTDNERLDKAKNLQRVSVDIIDRLNKQNVEIKEGIKKAEAVLKNLEKNKPATDKGALKNLFAGKEDKLQIEYDKLKKIPENQMTNKQIKRFNELKEKLELKNRLNYQDYKKAEKILLSLKSQLKQNEQDIHSAERLRGTAKSDEIDIVSKRAAEFDDKLDSNLSEIDRITRMYNSKGDK